MNGPISPREDGSFLRETGSDFEEFADYFSIPAAFMKGLPGFQAVGGFALHILNATPSMGETLVWQGCQFEIVAMEGGRIDKILFGTPAAGSSRLRLSQTIGWRGRSFREGGTRHLLR